MGNSSVYFQYPLWWKTGQHSGPSDLSNGNAPIYFFSYSEITHYPESFLKIFFFFAVIFLASEMKPFPLPIKEEKATQHEGWLVLSLFFLYVQEMRWKTEVQWSTSLLSLPSGQLHIQSSYKCPLYKVTTTFYFVHKRYKLWWTLYRSYSAVRPLHCWVSWDIRSSDDLTVPSSHSIDLLMIWNHI